LPRRAHFGGTLGARLRTRLGGRRLLHARRGHSFVEPPRIRERFGLGVSRRFRTKPGEDFQVAVSKPVFCNENFRAFLRQIGFPAGGGNAGSGMARKRLPVRPKSIGLLNK
jgi:hypothetical protein